MVISFKQVGRIQVYMSKNNVTFTEIATKNMAKLNVKSEHIELSFASYIKNFQDYVNIDGAEYLRDERKFIIPLSQESTLCNIFSGSKCPPG